VGKRFQSFGKIDVRGDGSGMVHCHERYRLVYVQWRILFIARDSSALFQHGTRCSDSGEGRT
jgi:hypothetical protein